MEKNIGLLGLALAPLTARTIQATYLYVFSSWKVKIEKRAVNAKRMLILALMRCLMGEVKTRKFKLISLKKRQISEIKVNELNTYLLYFFS